MKAGATDFVEKPYAGETLLGMVRSALDRWQVVATDGTRVAEARRQLAVLSPREREVLDAVAAGKASKAIAFELGLSVRTVEVHRANILAKLKVDNAALAVAKLVAAQH
jgi:two-component system response regulator FixJ